MKKTIPTTEIKALVKNLTGYDVSVRKGKGSMKGYSVVHMPLELYSKGFSFKPFERSLKEMFDIDRVGYDVVIILN